ncbi:MAG: hypothetical protein U0031_19690 [Thermomicrobiales bacterium]
MRKVLYASGEGIEDEGERVFGVLAVKAEPRRNTRDPGQMKDADRRIRQQRHYRESRADVDEAGVLAEIDVFVAVQAMLDAPLATTQRLAWEGDW